MSEEKNNSAPIKKKSLSFLEKVLIVLVVILTIFLIISLISNKIDLNKEKSLKIQNKAVVDDYCEENILIDKIMFRTLKSEIENGPRDYGDIVSLWKDGSFIQKAPKWHVSGEIPDLKCYVGNKSNGENENYFYCKNLYYTKTLINLRGEKLENHEYIIDLVLDKNNYTISHNNYPGWTSQLDLITTHKVVEAKCKKIA